MERKKRELSTIETQRTIIDKKIHELFDDFEITTGKSLLERKVSDIISNPKNTLDLLQKIQIEINNNSEKYLQQLQRLNKEKNELIGERRIQAIKLDRVQSSINYAQKYKNYIDSIRTIDEADLNNSVCPFCKKENDIIKIEANKLNGAIDWLNQELRRTPRLLDSFTPERKKIQAEILEKDCELRKLQKDIDKILSINEKLKKNKSLEEQGLKIKLSIENLLEEIIEHNNSDIYNSISVLETEIATLEEFITKKYNPEESLKNAESYINEHMKKIGDKLDFESTYRPINLRFDINTFELYHLKGQKRIYLRSMGSGANWLNSHISLFTSLLSYFCSLQSSCSIPTFLFIDQPSQVYFPTLIDNKNKFDPEKLKEQTGENKKKTDEDLHAVTNLFDQLVLFCKQTLENTGIEPQIIITDHADHLELKNANFEDLVNGRRWRENCDGFIKMNDLQVSDLSS